MTRNILFAILAIAVLVPGAVPLGAKVEGLFWPVVGPAKIENILKYEDGWTYFSMSAPKLRNCNWRDTRFYLGDRFGSEVPAPFEHLDPPKVRGTGNLFWARSRVAITPEQLENEAFSNVHHKCGRWHIWLTITPFYH